METGSTRLLFFYISQIDRKNDNLTFCVGTRKPIGFTDGHVWNKMHILSKYRDFFIFLN